MNDYPTHMPVDPEKLPYHYSVSYLDFQAERRLLEALLSSLGFTPTLEAAPTGLSGLKHRDTLVGVDSQRSHMVVVQSGFQQLFVLERPRAQRLGTPYEPPDKRSLDEREEELRRELIFSAYDLKARYEDKGIACDILYFLNAASPEEGLDLHALALERQSKQQPPLPVATNRYSGTNPPPRLPLGALRRNALSTGAAFLGLSDLSPDELADLTRADSDRTVLVARQALDRLRLAQYFHPPADEFLLGALAGEHQGLPNSDLVKATDLTRRLQHPLAASSLLKGVDIENPLEVARALKKKGFVRYEGTIAHTTDSGAQIVHKFAGTPQESWIMKIGKLLSLFKGW